MHKFEQAEMLLEKRISVWILEFMPYGYFGNRTRGF